MMVMRVKVFRHLKAAASLTGVVMLAFIIAWVAASVSFTTEEELYRNSLAVSNQQKKQWNKESGDHKPRKGKVGEGPPGPEENPVKQVQHASFLKILKLAAEDFNLTCSHSVPMQRPKNFTKYTKNPCYWDKAAGKLRCLPYFYIPGFPKCGTTDFYNFLKIHPEYLRTGKEFHWHNHLQFTQDYSDLEVYLHRLQPAGNKIEQDLKEKGFSRKITGDFTPDYLCDNMRWRCLEGNAGLEAPRYTNAHSIYSLTPNAKFIIFMREPVDRLYSRFKHMIYVSPDIFGKYWGDPSPETFHQAAMRAIRVYTACFQNFPVRQCLYNESLFEQTMINDIGIYSACLQDFVNLFPRENFLFLKFEEYTESREKIYNRVLKFLDLGPLPKHLQGKLNSTEVHNAGHVPNSPMLNKTRVALRRFFSPFVQELKKIVGSNLIKSWGY
ncbi:hypothetical protein RRG08_015844 [Elysia crispata]|uniref:Sulfotransferase domain-containing protein n=1 Tax=Elysia crispata TaxID=231223 RepID=A0AAE1E8P3_9GAST|nr:hypothetical protein RRG08_015844 [Elysia crispata]